LGLPLDSSHTLQTIVTRVASVVVCLVVRVASVVGRVHSGTGNSKPPEHVQRVVIQNLATDATGMTSNAFLVVGPPGVHQPATDDDGATGQRVLVDCGANFDAPSAVRDHVDELDAVVLTHTHPDHVGTLPDLRAAFDVETWGYDPTHSVVDNELGADETVTLGTERFETLHTPGHKDDHLCLFGRESGVLFAGDLVFADGAFGRTDLAEGDRDELVDSIDRLREWVAGDLTEIHTGHGRSITSEPEASLELSARAARVR
jgi:glyoxylase-like metal-dependent hydrolase (beta-lactamase superfamily II)